MNSRISGNFFQECWFRFKKPWCGSFTAYFIIVIVVFSAGGIFAAILDNNNSGLSKVTSIASNISTYFIALIIPSIINILLSFWSFKYKVSLIIYLVAGLFVSFVLLWLSNTIYNYTVFFPALF
ncbi:MAG: hypothetical protein RBQ97_10325, partial [Acholeplasma sp.]|nr:hypothetical protein [Acholeplasma sp.]